METRGLGKTGLEVTRLGFGLAEIERQEFGGGDVSDAARVLETALDGGINLLDTVACYAGTEDLVGRAVATGGTNTFSQPSASMSWATP